jgi:sigma-E factor negative regulatory protein RseA
MDRHSKKMDKESCEHLSCLMDGEINRDTSRFLVRRLGSDSELRATWARYHVVRDCLRHQEGNLAGDGFSHAVQQALLDDSTPEASHRLSAKWLKPVSGFAIAASVALMAIVTVGPGQIPVSGPMDGQAENSQLESFVSPDTGLGSTAISQPVNGASAVINRQRMNSYRLRHYQVVGSAGGNGFVAFVPIVSTRESEPVGDSDQSEGEQKNLKNGNQAKPQ